MSVSGIGILSKSGRPLSIASGHIKLRARVGELDAGAFTKAVDASGVLRRTSETNEKTDGQFVEIGCDASYGPAHGASKSDLRRELHAIARRLSANALEDPLEGEVFRVSVTKLGPSDVARIVSEMEEKIGDLSVPMPERAKLANKLERLMGRKSA